MLRLYEPRRRSLQPSAWTSPFRSIISNNRTWRCKETNELSRREKAIAKLREQRFYGRVLPPRSEEELIERARHLAGRNLGEIAARLHVPLPESQARAKGLVGQLVEKALGASAGNRGAPDFLEIGVELKTLPIGADGKPKESTFVASLPLMTLTEIDYEDSFVAKKLSRVLWVPIQAHPALALRDRRVGRAILWSPTAEERAVLRADYERVAHLVLDGAHSDITGRLGTYLQVRPKAADSTVRGKTMDDLGQIVWTGPRGFYLRPQFTHRIVESLTLPLR